MWERGILSQPPQRAAKKPEKRCWGLGKRNREKDGLREILSSMFRMPAPAFYTDAMIHISGAGTVQIDNCRGILLYNENAIELDMGETRLQLTGDALTLETVEKGIILVRGRLFGLTFFYDKNGERTAKQRPKKGRAEGDGGAGC